MNRKLLNILLAVCMVFTLLPMQAFGTEGGASTSTSSVTDSGATLQAAVAAAIAAESTIADYTAITTLTITASKMTVV